MENPPVNDKAPTKIFIALPCYWNVDPMFTQCLMKTIHGLKVPVVIRWCIGDSLVGRARNRLTREFLSTDCTHLLWIDTDLVFSLDHIERIVSHGEAIVGGLYCKKQEGEPQLVLNRFDTIDPLVGDALQSVKYIGTGFMCIAREVFDKMAATWPEDSYKADESDLPEHDYWRVGVYQFADGSKRYLSEDWWFCQRALELGYKIYADMKILLGHVGHATFPLRTQEAALFGERCGSSVANHSEGEVKISYSEEISPTETKG